MTAYTTFDNNSTLIRVAARLRHIATTRWGTRRYLVMEALMQPLTEEVGWIVLAGRPLCFALQRHHRSTLGHRPPAAKHRRRQAMPPADRTHRQARLIRLPEHLQLLFCRKSSMFMFAHGPCPRCRFPAADQSLSYSCSRFVQKSVKLHRPCHSLTAGS